MQRTSTYHIMAAGPSCTPFPTEYFTAPAKRTASRSGASGGFVGEGMAQELQGAQGSETGPAAMMW